MKLQLFSPFGQTMASATARAGGASLTTSDGKTFQADTTDELVHQVLGWRLPVDSLPAWLSGEQLAAVKVEKQKVHVTFDIVGRHDLNSTYW